MLHVVYLALKKDFGLMKAVEGLCDSLGYFVFLWVGEWTFIRQTQVYLVCFYICIGLKHCMSAAQMGGVAAFHCSGEVPCGTVRWSYSTVVVCRAQSHGWSTWRSLNI